MTESSAIDPITHTSVSTEFDYLVQLISKALVQYIDLYDYDFPAVISKRQEA